MRILVFKPKYAGESRYFVVTSEFDVSTVALKLLNEIRILGALEGAEKEFVDAISDEQDGDNALSYLARHYNMQSITPEVF